MDDAIRATIELMEAPKENIKVRSSYNLAGLSFSPAEVAAAIQKHYPDFNVSYSPDSRQAIAAKWPDSINDSPARDDWNWQPQFKMEELVETMLTKLQEKYAAKKLTPSQHSSAA
jgi:nucleoside-diphosphate-sugar epimerase